MNARQRALFIVLGLAVMISLLVSQDGAPVSSATTLASDILHLPLVHQPVPTPTPTVTPTPMPTPTPTRIASEDFGYGIQAAMVSGDDSQVIFDAIDDLGLNWVKQQVQWSRYNNPAPGEYDWSVLDRVVESALANDTDVLFSVVKASDDQEPDWVRPEGTDPGLPADPEAYGDFLHAMAKHYRGQVKAYEIWNEQNLSSEWKAEIDATKYVDLLEVAYGAIKDADPEAIVISGGLAPTGAINEDAIDDRLYLRQMYDAGLVHYCDAVGAHPSGYNLPPDADWRTYEDPDASFRGPFENRHPSWSFKATMEDYRAIMVARGDTHKRIWPTEFGWASVDGLGVDPVEHYEYAEDNTEEEQAAYIVRAYEMGRSWGWVGPMFLWNLNFAPVVGVHDEKAAFGIVYENWDPRPAFGDICDMPK